MPQIDLTITISVIVALAAIICPLITAIINNRYQLKLKVLDIEQKNFESTILYKRKVFEDYLSSAGLFVIRGSSQMQKPYADNYLVALMYAPDEWRDDMIAINEHTNRREFSAATKLLESLTTKIRSTLQIM